MRVSSVHHQSGTEYAPARLPVPCSYAFLWHSRYFGKLHLVDLAGSECVANSGATRYSPLACHRLLDCTEHMSCFPASATEQALAT